MSDSTPERSEPERTESQESPLTDLSIKVGLAVFSFLLGLLATYVTNTFLKDKMQLGYSVSPEPVIAVRPSTHVDPSLSELVKKLTNTTEFKIRIQNTGDLPVEGFATLLVFSPGARIVAHSLRTRPEREVPVTEEALTKPNELRLSAITLDASQAVDLDVYVESRGPATVKLYPNTASSGKVTWEPLSTSANPTLESSLLSLLRLAILVFVLPGLVVALPQAVGAFFYGLASKSKGGERELELSRTVLLSGTIGVLVASALRWYLCIRMLEPATVVVRQLVGQFS